MRRERAASSGRSGESGGLASVASHGEPDEQLPCGTRAPPTGTVASSVSEINGNEPARRAPLLPVVGR
jgi:hypothetical protein